MANPRFACFGLPDLFPNVQSLNALFINHSVREGAMVNLVYADDGVKSRCVEFCRRYATGGMLCTNNLSTLSAFRNPANHHTYYYPDISDISQLHKIHRCIDKDLGYGTPKLTLYDNYGGDVERYVQQEVILAPCDYQCQIGWVYKIPAGFAATWKGAAIMTWGMMFPFKQLRMARAKRRANALADRLCGTHGK